MHSSRAAESKRRALEKYASERMLYVPNIKMYRRLRSGSVHFLGTCEKKAAAQCQILIFPAGDTRFFFGRRCCAAVFFRTRKVH